MTAGSIVRREALWAGRPSASPPRLRRPLARARSIERMAEVVRLRFYAGLSVEEVAQVLETSKGTVLRDWAFARAWLYGEITRG